MDQVLVSAIVLCFRQDNLLHILSLNPGIQMGSRKLLEKPKKMSGVTL